jgi:hypothetical protein
MSSEILIAIVGALLSLLFAYVPGASEWYEKLGYDVAGNYDDGTKKRLVMLGMLVVVAAVGFGLSCAGFAADFKLALTCDRAGATGLVWTLVVAIMANQTAHTLAKNNAAKVRKNRAG